MLNITNENNDLKYITRAQTARSSFSAVSSSSRHLSVSPSIQKRIQSAPPDRQQNKTFDTDSSSRRNLSNVLTVSINGKSVKSSVDKETGDQSPLPDHITPTQYRPETARSNASSIFVISANPLEDTITGKYQAPPLAEEDYFEGKESQKPSSASHSRRLKQQSCNNAMPQAMEGSTAIKCMCCGGTALFFLFLIVGIMVSSLHTIDEGNVGIYFVHGALDDEFTYPGTHWAVPFVTDIKEITIRPVTSTMDQIRTITKDGIGNTFSNIQVLSDVKTEKLIPLIKKFGLEFRDALIFDRISEELRIFCANHTVDEVYNELFLDIVQIVKGRVTSAIDKLIGDESVKILNIVIPKPEIPIDIARNYKQVKVQWTEQLVATQQQKTDKIKKETESIKAVLDAEREKKVLAIEIEKDILQKEGKKNLSSLENQIIKEREENQANVDNYKKTQEAEANARLYTGDYVKLEMAKALSQNTKFFFSGESSPLGAVLTKIMGENK